MPRSLRPLVPLSALIVSLPACSAPTTHAEDRAPREEGVEAADASSWRFEVEPYAWIPSTHGTGTTSTTPPLDIDLVGTLDAALPLAFGAESPDGRYIVLVDGFYLRLKSEDGLLETSTEVGMIEAGGGIALDEARRWHALAGLRYVDIRYDTQLGSVEGRADAGWLDPWFGARGVYELNDRWSTRLRGDIGGFGVGTEFTWQALALLRARLGRGVALDFGYRAIQVDYDRGSTRYDVLFHGPLAGLGVSF